MSKAIYRIARKYRTKHQYYQGPAADKRKLWLESAPDSGTMPLSLAFHTALKLGNKSRFIVLEAVDPKNKSFTFQFSRNGELEDIKTHEKECSHEDES